MNRDAMCREQDAADQRPRRPLSPANSRGTLARRLVGPSLGLVGLALSAALPLAVGMGLAGGLGLAGSAGMARADEIDFNRDIRPILTDKCFRCHGPDSGSREADLRLDREEDAKADRDGNPAVVPRKPDKSELIRRITHEDESQRMPPADSEKTLSAGRDRAAQALDRRRRRLVARLGLCSAASACRFPRCSDETWPANWIDHFVLARLEAEKLAPSPDADKVTLIRRLYIDLIGLPPTPAEVDAFLADAVAAGLRKGGRPAAGVASLWRADGRLLVGSGALRRHGGLPRRPGASHFALSRLRHRRPSTRICRSINSRASNWPATCCRSRRSSKRSPPATTACCKRRTKGACRPRSIWRSTPPTTCGICRPCGWGQRWAAPVPRSQVRSLHGERLLFDAGVLRRRRRGEASDARHRIGRPRFASRRWNCPRRSKARRLPRSKVD